METEVCRAKAHFRRKMNRTWWLIRCGKWGGGVTEMSSRRL